MNNLSVVIPSRNAKNLEACVRFGIWAAGEQCRIIVVDDGLGQWQDGIMYVEGVKPFIFSRNVNIGIRAAERDDVVILNDDAILQTPGGFSLLQQAAEERPEYGLIAATTNNVGNKNQLPRSIGLREDPVMVCFIAVLIPRRTINVVGLLDERYCLDYGCEDNDYCEAVRRAGLKIGIHDGCFVDHKSLTSTFRGNPTESMSYQWNYALFKQKWGIA
jgi:GT2 family glycosyltransferase